MRDRAGEAVDEKAVVDRMFDMRLAGTYVVQVGRPSPLDPVVTLNSNALAIKVDN
jgi:hypothetical protein